MGILGHASLVAQALPPNSGTASVDRKNGNRRVAGRLELTKQLLTYA